MFALSAIVSDAVSRPAVPYVATIKAHNVIGVVYLQFERTGIEDCIELTVIYAAISCAANKMHARKAPTWLIVLL